MVGGGGRGAAGYSAGAEWAAEAAWPETKRSGSTDGAWWMRKLPFAKAQSRDKKAGGTPAVYHQRKRAARLQ